MSARPECPRCRRPQAPRHLYEDWLNARDDAAAGLGPPAVLDPAYCYRTDARWEAAVADCDRLLLERAENAEALAERLTRAFAQIGFERDALAAAGDALADATAGTITEAIAAWRALRSPEGGVRDDG